MYEEEKNRVVARTAHAYSYAYAAIARIDGHAILRQLHTTWVVLKFNYYY